MFYPVAKADVTQNPDIKMIQEEIAHCLGFSDIKKEENVWVTISQILLRDSLRYKPVQLR